ncbi:MAG: hypothetical protein DRN12_01900 [Thermoplasmata archaeon]|nr:MAG: hypothetical protein DRN12_01900 [Thermoplasmata archaeon]
MRITTCILLFSMLSLSLFSSTIHVIAENDETEPSEVNMYVDGGIPTVQTSNWTNINLIIVDRTGIDWERFQEQFSWQVKWLWPVTHPEWRRFLGYTTLKVEPSVGEGNPSGWHLKFNRSTLPDTTTGHVHKVQLQAMVDDTTVDYSIVVRIKCTRYDVFGDIMGVSYLYLPLKAMPLSNIKMAVDTTEKTAPPKSITNFQFDITNEGNYREMFGFKVESKEGLISLLNTQTIVLEPKETKKVNLKVFTPSVFLDFGTPREINIYAYSYETNTTIPLGSITVVTQGIYISPLTGIIAIPIFILFLLLYLLYRYWERREQEEYGRPTKPWLIPVEREYLQELKKKDYKEYRRTLKMMKEEYQSAMLWYKYSIKEKSEGMFLPLLGKTSGKIEEEKKAEETKTLEKEEEALGRPIENLSNKEDKKSVLSKLLSKLTEESPEEKSVEEKPLKTEKEELESTEVSDIKQEKQILEKSWREKEKEKRVRRIKREQEKQKRKLVNKI